MWCNNCQQDVPALARGARGPLVCPRCEHDLPMAGPETACSEADSLSDSGIGLETYDGPTKEQLEGRPTGLDSIFQEQEHQHLKRIGRRLGSVRPRNPAPRKGWMRTRIDGAHPMSGPAQEGRLVAPEADMAAIAYRAGQDPQQPKGTTTPWLVSFLLLGGVVCFAVGAWLLAWATIAQWTTQLQQGGLLQGPGMQWELTVTIISQGILILSLVWLSLRLWRNSRRINRQLQGIQGQLAELQRHAGTLAGSGPNTSCSFYDHFAQGTSSQMLLANLRGGLDQLAARISTS